MKLLTFAHRGEAKTFLKNDRLVPVPFIFDGLYKNDQIYLLIHGEGIQSTSEKVSAVCGAFRKDILSVINLGVCGSLKMNEKLGKIHPIRTCYCEGEFKSYSTNNSKGLDIISSKERVTDVEKAKKLSMFAPLVDRESWAVGSVCNTLNIPFYSFKLISDYSNNVDICQMVSSKSEEISDSLYIFFKSIEIKKKGEKISQELLGTVSQNRLFNSFRKKMQLKGLEIEVNSDNNLVPKKRMVKTLEKMERDLFPFEAKLKEKLKNLTQDLTDKKIELKFSKDFEDPSLSLSFKIQTKEDLDKVVSSLNTLPIQKINDLLNGKIDV